jgi:hypothetical protein
VRQTLLRAASGATIGSVRATLGTAFSPEFLAVYIEGLRKAGLPEA